jgi:hypothetical protein
LNSIPASHVFVCFIITATQCTTFSSSCTCHPHWQKLRDRSQVFTWRSCGDVTVMVQNFSFTIIRHQNMHPHITHIKYGILWHSYAKPWFQLKKITKEKREWYLNLWSVCSNHMVQRMWVK